MNREAFSLLVALAMRSMLASDVVAAIPSGNSFAVKRTNISAGSPRQLNSCGGGGSYSAGIGLNLNDTTFSVAPTYRLPQSCLADQIAQWKGRAWACGTMDSSALPVGTANQTLRYDARNMPTANNLFQAFDDGGLLAGGALGIGTIPAIGSGTRLMWYPAKAAFRAGNVTTQWDDANVGQYSVATGYATTASGDFSMAAGNGSTATGANSVAMGFNTKASGGGSAAMGDHSQASGPDSIALGYLTSATGSASTASGFSTTASGDASSAMGSLTIASGAYSTAMGRDVSTDGYRGSFIYGDSTLRSTAKNTADNQFVVVASGGVYFFTEKERSTGAGVPPGSSSWIVLSDRDMKTAVQMVNPREVLEKVAALPMNTWQYKTQDAKYRHIGPMAQDFYAAFHLGESDKGIDTVDADGVALAAIQGLHAELAEKNREIAVLNKRISSLESLAGDVAEMKTKLAALHVSGATSFTVALRP